jgi:hypothetical protein
MIKAELQPGVVVHTYNSSIQQTEAGGSPVEGQPGLHSKTISTTKQNKQSFLANLEM